MVYGAGLGKNRTKLGEWLDQNNLTQKWFQLITKINPNTVTKLCSDKSFRPSYKLMRRVIIALKGQHYDIGIYDFWRYDEINKLDKWLIENGYTYTQVANICDVCEGTIQNICNGKKYPSKLTMESIITGLKNEGHDVSLNDFWEIVHPNDSSVQPIRINAQLTKFGLWMFENEIDKKYLATVANVSTPTIQKLCTQPDYVPSGNTLIKIMKIVKKIDDTKDITFFWEF